MSLVSLRCHLCHLCHLIVCRVTCCQIDSHSNQIVKTLGVGSVARRFFIKIWIQIKVNNLKNQFICRTRRTTPVKQKRGSRIERKSSVPTVTVALRRISFVTVIKITKTWVQWSSNRRIVANGPQYPICQRKVPLIQSSEMTLSNMILRSQYLA